MKKRKNILMAAIVAVVLIISIPMAVEAREVEQYACNFGAKVGICHHYVGRIFGITLWDYWDFECFNC